MGWLKNSIIFIGSFLVVIGSVIWGIVDGGFEPWIVAIGGFVAIALNFDFIKNLDLNKRKLSPEQKISARDKWRQVFENYFLEAARSGHRVGDTIVHDVDRLDIYPDTPKEKGISSWFRVGLMGTYHRGILLGLRWTYLEEKDGEWIENGKGDSENSVKVMLLGEVPYESIESVNFEGDDYYNKPHIFCHFDHQGEPYERLYYGEQFQLDEKSLFYYRQVEEYKPAPKWKIWKQS